MENCIDILNQIIGLVWVLSVILTIIYLYNFIKISFYQFRNKKLSKKFIYKFIWVIILFVIVFCIGFFSAPHTSTTQEIIKLRKNGLYEQSEHMDIYNYGERMSALFSEYTRFYSKKRNESICISNNVLIKETKQKDAFVKDKKYKNKFGHTYVVHRTVYLPKEIYKTCQQPNKDNLKLSDCWSALQ